MIAFGAHRAIPARVMIDHWLGDPDHTRELVLLQSSLVALRSTGD